MSEKRILIIDDDDEIRELLEFDVRASGYFVDTASDGMEGLNKALNNTYDLILLDVMMPHLDGFETLKIIRNKEHLENLPIIMLTAVDSEQQQISGLKSGADDYIVKPFSLPNLLARIEAILRRVKIAQKTIANHTKSVNIHVSSENPIVPLTQREKEIIIKRYGLNGEKEITQKELAKELNISRSYVSRIEKKAIEKLNSKLAKEL